VQQCSSAAVQLYDAMFKRTLPNAAQAGFGGNIAVVLGNVPYKLNSRLTRYTWGGGAQTLKLQRTSLTAPEAGLRTLVGSSAGPTR
jgi:hypothetical protein